MGLYDTGHVSIFFLTMMYTTTIVFGEGNYYQHPEKLRKRGKYGHSRIEQFQRQHNLQHLSIFIELKRYSLLHFALKR